MKKIKIPYGNWGQSEREYDVLDEYKSFSLILEPGHDIFSDEYKIVGPKGLILLRNMYNRHLPDANPGTWKIWVDWVLSLPPDTSNITDLSGRATLDFSGFAPNGLIKNFQS